MATVIPWVILVVLVAYSWWNARVDARIDVGVEWMEAVNQWAAKTNEGRVTLSDHRQYMLQVEEEIQQYIPDFKMPKFEQTPNEIPEFPEVY